MENVSLREKKRGRLKVAILNEMLRLLSTKDFFEISVEELCQNVDTTKVTFFKYFRYKEQVLDYFIQRWSYDRSYDIHRNLHHGEQGLLHLFQTISEDPLGKKIMVSLIHYYSKLNEKPPAIEVSPYEYYLFNQEALQNSVEPFNLSQMFTHYLTQIESISSTDHPLIIGQLLALMYGVPIQTHMMGLEDMYTYYESGVKRLVR